MKIRTKLYFGQIVFQVYYDKIVKREVTEVRAYISKEGQSVKYILTAVDDNISRQEVIEEHFKREHIFLKKDDAKMYLYNLIAAM